MHQRQQFTSYSSIFDWLHQRYIPSTPWFFALRSRVDNYCIWSKKTKRVSAHTKVWSDCTCHIVTWSNWIRTTKLEDETTGNKDANHTRVQFTLAGLALLLHRISCVSNIAENCEKTLPRTRSILFNSFRMEMAERWKVIEAIPYHKDVVHPKVCLDLYLPTDVQDTQKGMYQLILVSFVFLNHHCKA